MTGYSLVSLIATLLALATISAPDRSALSATGAADTMQDQVAILDSTRVYYRLLGNQDPSVVLVSGVGDGARTWSAGQPEIAQFAKVLAYDRPGLGVLEQVVDFDDD